MFDVKGISSNKSHSPISSLKIILTNIFENYSETRSLGVSDLCSETMDSWFESGC